MANTRKSGNKNVAIPPTMGLSKQQINSMKNELNQAASMPLPNNGTYASMPLTVLTKEQINSMKNELNQAASMPLPNNQTTVRAKKVIKTLPTKKASTQTRRDLINIAIKGKKAERNAKVMKHRGIPDKAELLKEVDEVKEELKKENTQSKNDTFKQEAEKAAIDAVTKAIEKTDDNQALETMADLFKSNVAEVTMTNENDPNPLNNQPGNSSASDPGDPGETVSAAVAGAEEAAKELAGNPNSPKNAVATNAPKNAIANNNINKAIANNATQQINGPSNASNNSDSELSDAKRLVATINLDELLPEPDSDILNAVNEAAGESNVQKAADIAYKAVMKAGGSMDQAIRAAYMAAFKVLVKSGKSLFDITKTATKVVLDIALQSGLKLGDIILSIAKAAASVFFKIIRSAGLTLGVSVSLTFHLIITLLKIIGAPIAELTKLAGQVIYDVGINAGESATEFIKTVATTIAREAYSAAIHSGATAKMAGELAFEAVVSVLKQIGYGAALITTVALNAVKDAVVELTRIATNTAIALARDAAEQAYKQAINAGKGAEAAAAAAFEASVAAIKQIPGITLDIGAIAGNAAVYAITNLGKYTTQIAGLIAKMAATLAYQAMLASGAVLADAAKAAANTAIPIIAKAAENVKDVIRMAAQAGASAATSVATKAASSIWNGLKSFISKEPPSGPPNGPPSASLSRSPSGPNGSNGSNGPPNGPPSGSLNGSLSRSPSGPNGSSGPPNGSSSGETNNSSRSIEADNKPPPSNNPASRRLRMRRLANGQIAAQNLAQFPLGHNNGIARSGLRPGTEFNTAETNVAHERGAYPSRIRKPTKRYKPGNTEYTGGRRTRRR
jgi:hypothetical protein